MKQLTLKSTALLFFTSVFVGVNAQTFQQTTDGTNVVTSAVPFLRISPDARSGAMGETGIAISPDANSSFWNLAKTIFAKEKTAIGFTYTPWLRDLGLNDVYIATLAGYHQLDEEQAIAASIRYFSLGNIQFTDFAGTNLQENRPREFSVDFGYSRKLNSKLSAGAAFRYINSSLANGAIGGVNYKAGNALALDLSLFHNGLNEQGIGWNWGVVLSNLGSKISYTNDAANKDYIPANLGVGVAYTKVFDETSKITLALDVNKLMVPTPPTATGIDSVDNVNLLGYRNQGVVSSVFKSFGDAGSFGNELKEFQVSFGAEYMYNDQFAFRLGYFYEDKNKGNRTFFTAGFGLKYNVAALNFSYLIPSGNGVTRNPLSNTLRFGLTFDIANK